MNIKISNLLLMYLMFLYLKQDKNGNILNMEISWIILSLFIIVLLSIKYSLISNANSGSMAYHKLMPIDLAIKDFYSCPYLVTCVTFFYTYFTIFSPCLFGHCDFFLSCIFGHLWLFHALFTIRDIFACCFFFFFFGGGICDLLQLWNMKTRYTWQLQSH